MNSALFITLFSELNLFRLGSTVKLLLRHFKSSVKLVFSSIHFANRICICIKEKPISLCTVQYIDHYFEI